jgi:2-amino-4-hydroxy-6-hydroxymethyldihydropteridine diphosphokinase
MAEVFVAAGSNFAPERHLACALNEITRGFTAVRASPWYRSRAADGAGADFVNLVVSFTSELSPREVRAQLKAIEARCGRTRSNHGVEVDLDLLMYGELVLSEHDLVLPRPELLTRAYLLGPLAQLAPALRHPGTGRNIGELWGQFDKRQHPLERLPPRG